MQVFPKFDEECCLELASTSSITSALCYGDSLAVEALHFIKQHSINNLSVTDSDGVLVGTITWQQIVKAGIVA